MGKIEIPDHIIRRIEVELLLYNQESLVQITMEEFLEEITELYRLRREALTALLEGGR
ncbi:MAG: hypothetical protein ACFFAU_19145 [Candidatus Hodarchaeota archaeon]